MECMLASRCTAEHIKIFLKETDILGMCMSERKDELTILFYYIYQIFKEMFCIQKKLSHTNIFTYTFSFVFGLVHGHYSIRQINCS